MRARMTALALCLLLAAGGAFEATAATDWEAQGPRARPTLAEWAAGQPRQYAPDGREIPFSGTPYFWQYPMDTIEALGAEGRAARWEPVLRTTGVHCAVYVDAAVNPQPDDSFLMNLTTEFDGHIWSVDTSVFGSVPYSSVDIFIYPIDGGGGVGGYYNGGNDLYIDSYDLSWSDEILTHEFQHCIHRSKDASEQAWVNEGCSDLAIQLCYGFFNNSTTTLKSHLKAFAANPDNDLTAWDGELYDYGSSYAFLSYFHEHYGGNSTVRALVADTARGTTGINNRLAGTGKNFTTVFRDWTVANYMNNDSISPAYGYSNLSLRLGATSCSAYPFGLNASVKRWAAEYYSFAAEGADLELSFNGSDGAPLEVRLGLLGIDPVPSIVWKMPLNAARDGCLTVPRLGLDFSEAVMVVSAAGAAGNFSFRADAIDRTAPMTVLNMTPPVPQCADGYYNSSPLLTLTPGEKRCTTFYRWDGGAPQPYFGPLAAPEGRHTFSYRSRDAAGNEEAEHSTVIKVDRIPPATVLAADPPYPDGRDGWYLAAPELELSTEIGAMTCWSWDGGAEANYTAPLRPAEGVHTLGFFSVDAHGNREALRNVTFKLDTGPPATSIYVYPPAPDGQNGWYVRPPLMRLETEPGAEVRYSWNFGPEKRFRLQLDVPEGRNILRYWAVDHAGNNETAHELEVKLDTLPPDCTLRADPPAPDGRDGYYLTPVSLELETEPYCLVQCRWDRGPWTPVCGTLQAPEGVHTLSCYATDLAGNRGPESTLELRIDSVVPVTQLFVNPDLGDVWYIESPAVMVLTGPDAVPYYSLDGGPPLVFDGRLQLPSGIHDLTYWSEDGPGNVEEPRCRHFRLDLDDPIAKLAVPGPYAIETFSALLDATGAEDSGSGVVAYRFIFGDGQESGWTSSPVVLHIYARQGSYRASVVVRDVAGRVSARSESEVTVLAAPSSDGLTVEPPPGQASAWSSYGYMAVMGASVLVLAAAAAWVLVRSQKGRRRGGLGEGRTRATGKGQTGGRAEDRLKSLERISDNGGRVP